MSNNDNNDNDFNDLNNITPYSTVETQCKYIDESDYITELKGINNQTLMSLNIQSLPSKFNELEELVRSLASNQCEPDFICLQETWRIVDPSL